jgi:hypothetical protein
MVTRLLNINNSNKFTLLCLMLFVLFGVAFVLFSALAPLTADDFAHYVEIRDTSLLKWISFVFSNYTGKIVGLFFQPVLFSGQLGFFVAKILSACFFLTIPFFFFRILKLNIPIYLYGLFLLVFILSHQEFLSQTVFWATGGVGYTWPAFLTLLWLMILITSDKLKLQVVIPLFFLGVMVGMVSEQTAHFTFVITVIVCFFKASKCVEDSKKSQKVLWGVCLSAVVLGLILFFSAPGNYSRAAMVDETNIDFQIAVKNVPIILKNALINGRFSLIGGLTSAVFLIFLSLFGFVKNYLDKNTGYYLVPVFFMSIGIFASLGPFYFIPIFAAHRTYVFSAILLFFIGLVLTLFGFKLIRKILNKLSESLFKNIVFSFLIFSLVFFLMQENVDGVWGLWVRLISATIAFCITFLLIYVLYFFKKLAKWNVTIQFSNNFASLIVVCFMVLAIVAHVVPQFTQLIPYRAEVLQRETQILQIARVNPDIVVQVNAIKSTQPSWLHYRDLIYGADDWVNKLYARYLGVLAIDTF